MKTYDELILQLKRHDVFVAGHDLPPHSTNLMHQLGKRDEKNIGLFNEVCSRYFQFRESLEKESCYFDSYVNGIVDSADAYLSFLVNGNPFSHQQDFSSSVIPEMFFFLFQEIIKRNGSGISVQAQNDLPIECMFDLAEGGRIIFKNKRLDLTLCLKSLLVLNGKEYSLPLPLLAMEIKTNLDKNMLAGIENSVAALKKTFPRCQYYVVSEFADFDTRKLNYASTDIDEIYILRNQKRAEVRSVGTKRNGINKELVKELVQKADYMLRETNQRRLELEQRMRMGKLI